MRQQQQEQEQQQQENGNEQQQQTQIERQRKQADEIELVSLPKATLDRTGIGKSLMESGDDDDDDDFDDEEEQDGSRKHDDDDDDDNDQDDGGYRHPPGCHTTISVTYPQLAKMAYGNVGEIAVRTGICLMQLGICLTYFIFVPHNLTASVYSLSRGAVRLPMWLGLCVMVWLEIPLCWIRDIRKLVHTNVAANALIFFGLVSSLYLALFVAPTTTPSSVALLSESNNDYDDGNNNVTLELSPPQASKVVPVDTTRARLAPWNDHWYLFIGTSVSKTCHGYIRIWCT